MLGKNYFHTRSKLGTAIEALSQLAEHAGVDPSRIAILRNLMANLKDPFLFVVVGEVNSGKSTLLNALFGDDFCSTNVLPTTDRIGFFRYGKEPHEFEVSDTLMEIYRPAEFLKDFNVVDTPGTNSIELHHQRITEQFLPMADLVLFVFSVTNPWGATAWDLLDRIHHQWKKKIVFILQQCDLRTEEEVTAIMEHLRRTAAHRFGQQFPIFSISAKQAFMAKTTAVDKERLWHASGFADLEQFISDVVESSETRLTKLINAWRGACYILGEVKERLATAAEIIRADTELLSGLEQSAREQEQRTGLKFEPLFEALDQSFMGAGLQAEPLLESRFRIFSTLMPPGKTPEEIENLVFATTMKAVRRTVASGAEAVEDDVRHLWERVAADLQEHFNLQLSVGETGRPDWTEQRQRLCAAVETRTAEVLKQLNLRDDLQRSLAGRNRWMWATLIGGLAAAAVGALLGWKGIFPWNAVAFGVAAFSLLIGAWIGNRTANQIRNLYTEKLERQRVAMGEAQRRTFTAKVGEFYRDFVRLFEPLRGVCQEHRQKYEPQLNAIAHLERSLLELERILRPVEQILLSRIEAARARAAAEAARREPEAEPERVAS
ncbi:MAG: dynamin family protein [Verrucomicrobiae bacterium]|nr:dynamin family protein [Verrucomicrobiae bacterium]MCP5540380.1 dynamin family protein [Akkermansiaceae bacterium]